MKTPEELRAMIDTGVNLIRFSKLFGTELEAYSFFAKMMQDRHCREKLQAVDTCVCCGDLLGYPTELEWRASIHRLRTGPTDLLLLPTGHMTFRRTSIPMKTYHSICQRCNRSVNLRRAIRKLLDVILFFCFMAAVLVAVPTLVFAIGLLFFAPETFRVFGPAAAAAIFILWLVVWGMSKARDWSIPASLREVGRTSFDLVSANAVSGGM